LGIGRKEEKKPSPARPAPLNKPAREKNKSKKGSQADFAAAAGTNTKGWRENNKRKSESFHGGKKGCTVPGLASPKKKNR